MPRAPIVFFVYVNAATSRPARSRCTPATRRDEGRVRRRSVLAQGQSGNWYELGRSDPTMQQIAPSKKHRPPPQVRQSEDMTCRSEANPNSIPLSIGNFRLEAEAATRPPKALLLWGWSDRTKRICPNCLFAEEFELVSQSQNHSNSARACRHNQF